MTPKGDRSTDTVMTFTLHETYWRMGFFNVPVRYDRHVRQLEGDVKLVLAPHGACIAAHVNRTANPNKTARIMGGTPPRDWFQSYGRLKGLVQVDLTDKTEIHLKVL